jgi:hypothetical protein
LVWLVHLKRSWWKISRFKSEEDSQYAKQQKHEKQTHDTKVRVVCLNFLMNDFSHFRTLGYFQEHLFYISERERERERERKWRRREKGRGREYI